MQKSLKYILIVLWVSFLGAYERPSSVDVALWESLKPYFLPEHLPVKKKLDKIFKKYRVISNVTSMEKAGFINPYPRKWTRLVVTKHPKLEGYVVKAYLDSQRYHQKMPEHHFWVLRIKGVNLIKDEIVKRNLQGLYKAPNKWIYPLPEFPPPSKKAVIRKNFILVEEDMDIYSDAKNEDLWRNSKAVTPVFLSILYRFLADLGLWDCAKPANIPFSKDGKIAFIDTQSFHRHPVKFDRLTPFLSESNQKHWTMLIQTNGQ